MAVNVDLLRQVKEHILAHPEEHDQGEWRRIRDCGTVMCVAGLAATLDGGEWLTDEPGSGYDAVLLKPRGRERATADGKLTRAVHVQDRGRRVLGLSERQATQLFWADKGRAMEIIDELLGETDG